MQTTRSSSRSPHIGPDVPGLSHHQHPCPIHERDCQVFQMKLSRAMVWHVYPQCMSCAVWGLGFSVCHKIPKNSQPSTGLKIPSCFLQGSSVKLELGSISVSERLRPLGEVDLALHFSYILGSLYIPLGLEGLKVTGCSMGFGVWVMDYHAKRLHQ